MSLRSGWRTSSQSDPRNRSQSVTPPSYEGDQGGENHYYLTLGPGPKFRISVFFPESRSVPALNEFQLIFLDYIFLAIPSGIELFLSCSYRVDIMAVARMADHRSLPPVFIIVSSTLSNSQPKAAKGS